MGCTSLASESFQTAIPAMTPLGTTTFLNPPDDYWKFLRWICPFLPNKTRRKWSPVLIVQITTYVCIKLAMGSRFRWFYEETKIYNGVRAADLSELCHLPKLQPQSRKHMSKLIQGVLLRGWHNRMYHYDYTKEISRKNLQTISRTTHRLVNL